VRKMQVAIYQPAGDYGSFNVVANGLVEGLRDHGIEAGSVYYQQGELPSDDACMGVAVGIMVGPGNMLRLLSMAGHDHRWAMVAPNSTWLPPGLLWAIRENCTRVLVPSAWGKAVVVGAMQKEFSGEEADSWAFRTKVVPHGVSKSLGSAAAKVPCVVVPGRRNYLHLAESSIERKNTLHLIRRFAAAASSEVLTVVVSTSQIGKVAEFVADLGASGVVTVTQRWAVTPDVMGALLAQFDGVMQPSRAEGFGLVPLEALAVGVPCLVSAETGHLEWLKNVKGQCGCVPIQGGPMLVGVSYDPSGLAPTITIKSELKQFIEGIEQWQKLARENQAWVRENWSWESVTAKLAKEIKDLV